MAHIELVDGKKRSITPEQGVVIWNILQGRNDPTQEQERFISNIRKVYLNWRKAPDDYIEQNFDYIKPMAMADWVTDRSGSPIRPSNKAGFAFAKRWGLRWKGFK